MVKVVARDDDVITAKNGVLSGVSQRFLHAKPRSTGELICAVADADPFRLDVAHLFPERREILKIGPDQLLPAAMDSKSLGLLLAVANHHKQMLVHGWPVLELRQRSWLITIQTDGHRLSCAEAPPSLSSQMLQGGKVVMAAELALGLFQSDPVGPQRDGREIFVEGPLAIEDLIENPAAKKFIQRLDVMVVAQACQLIDATVRGMPLIGLKQQCQREKLGLQMLLIKVWMQGLKAALDDFEIKPDGTMSFQQAFEGIKAAFSIALAPKLKLITPLSVGIHGSRCCFAI